MNYGNKTDSYNSYEAYDKFKSARINSVNVFMGFEEGISKEKLKKLNLRKDALLLLKLKDKYELSEEQKNLIMAQREQIRLKKYPQYKLKDGRNLFALKESNLHYIIDLYEMSFKELDEISLDYLALIPNLNKLIIKLSNIMYNKKNNFQIFFPSLINLDLPFNNLGNEIFDYLKNIPTLKTLNLVGNKISGDIPNLKFFINLEELNLSYNNIESHFINLPNINGNDILIENNSETKIIENNDQINNQEINNDPNIKFNLNNAKYDVENLNKSKENFDEWQQYLKTNLQQFYHNLAQLPKLKYINLSNNNIHFFDVNPFYIQQTNGFRELEKIDFSYNLLEEEISILLIMNVPKLSHLDISNNPIINNKTSYENIEYEIYKNKNILLINNKIKNPFKNKKGKSITKKVAHRNIDDFFEKQKQYTIKKEQINSFTNFDKNVKIKVAELVDYKNKIENDENEFVDILERNEKINEEKHNISISLEENKNNFNILEDILRNKKTDDVFITNDPNQLPVIKKQTPKSEINTYDEFLQLAKKCFGKEKHYKKKIGIPTAYQQLRFVVSSFQTNIRQNNEKPNYLKSTVTQMIHKDFVLNSSNSNVLLEKENYLKEMKFLSNMNKIVKDGNSYSLID